MQPGAWAHGRTRPLDGDLQACVRPRVWRGPAGRGLEAPSEAARGPEPIGEALRPAQPPAPASALATAMVPPRDLCLFPSRTSPPACSSPARDVLPGPSLRVPPVRAPCQPGAISRKFPRSRTNCAVTTRKRWAQAAGSRSSVGRDANHAAGSGAPHQSWTPPGTRHAHAVGTRRLPSVLRVPQESILVAFGRGRAS